MPQTYQVRSAVPDDADLISRHRALMYLDMGEVNLEESEKLRDVSRPYLRNLLESGKYLGWLVEDVNDGIVAGAGVNLRELPHIPDATELDV